MKQIALAATLAASFLAVNLAAQPDPNYKPKRLNKAIELLQDDVTIFYTGAGGGGYDQGVKMAKTWADVIMYEMEHGAFDLANLRAFMQGLAKSGPTPSGHRIPTVIVTLPVLGYDEAYMKANSWVVAQVLATGVMGIHLCHARDPKAIETFVAASRYPFERPGIKQLPMEGMRGAGSQNFASQIWGISPNLYLQLADTWPLNPKGEIMLGLKIEDKHALANAEKNAAVPGIAFAEWGPTDQTMSQIGLAAYQDTSMPAGRRGDDGEGGGGGGRGRGPSLATTNPVLIKTRARVFAAVKANHEAFLNSCNESNVIDMIKEGVRVCTGNEATAKKGREFQDRKMPW
jgi:4-hydroxy-2-oxoheptanedioate aldolase